MGAVSDHARNGIPVALKNQVTIAGSLDRLLVFQRRGPPDPMKVRELITLIESDGWRQVRQKGSHRQFHHPGKTGTVTVAGKPNVDVPPGTLNSVLKQAGLKD